MKRRFTGISIFLGILIIVVSISGCSFGAETPVIESIRLSNGQTFNYYCFKTVSGAEKYFGITYSYSTEAINTQLDDAVKRVMTNKRYAVSITYMNGYYVINRKSGNTYYINFYY